MTGFFEEAEGVRSMTRLTLFLVTLAILSLVAVIDVYTLRAKEPSAAIITSLCGALSILAVKFAVAVINRNPAENAAQ